MMRRAVVGLVLLACTCLLRAQDTPAAVEDNDTSPLHQALVYYKTGKYDQALVAIKAALKANPSHDIPTDILYARILTELHQYDAAEKWLRSMYAPAQPEKLDQDANVLEVEAALGDLLLRKHSFDRAAKYYALVLKAKPDDPDIILKLVYANVGGSDLIAAGQYASQLKPLDPKNPYDMHASYYFAKAALAQAAGRTQEAEDAIQEARTNYGNTITDHYLKTYLEVFAAPNNGPNSDLTPPPLVKPADSAKP